MRIERIANIKKGTIHDFVRRNISDEAEAIYTDELRSHVGLETDTRKHESVNHSKEEWVVGDVHTNSVEGVWSLFKRSIVGSFHKMSVKHMDRLSGRAGVAVQQPRQPLHLPRRAPADHGHRSDWSTGR